MLSQSEGQGLRAKGQGQKDSINLRVKTRLASGCDTRRALDATRG